MEPLRSTIGGVLVAMSATVFGCMGGLVVDGQTGDAINGATVTAKNCSTCTSHSVVTPTEPGMDGSWAFDGYDGEPIIYQSSGAKAVRLRATAPGYLSRTLYHTVEWQEYNDELYDLRTIELYSGLLWDFDGDGLPNVQEAEIGTNAFDSDTDDDGLSDGWEVNGYNWVDYTYHGVDPLKQDVLVEVDYQKYTVGGVTHSAALSDAVIDKIEALFAGLPTVNPDGSTGIRVHIFQDDALPSTFNCATEYSTTTKFDSLHQDAFHYAALCIGAHGGATAGIGGQRFYVRENEINGDPSDDQTEEEQFWWYSTFVHELGHSLGLRHGGFENLNCKPNYPSLMNYAYDITFNGSDLTLADTEIQFSTGTFLPNVLDEAALGERTSFPGLTAADIGFLTNYGDPWVGAGFSISGNWVDWNRNGSYQLGLVAANITDGSNSCTGTALDVLNDHDDVTFLSDNLATTLSADAADTFFGHPEEISCTLH